MQEKRYKVAQYFLGKFIRDVAEGLDKEDANELCYEMNHDNEIYDYVVNVEN